MTPMSDNKFWSLFPLDPRAENSYAIDRVHADGTLIIRLDAHLTERLSLGATANPYTA